MTHALAKLAVVFMLLLGVVFATLASAGSRCARGTVCQQHCCNSMACCLVKNKAASGQPAEQVPVQKSGHNPVVAVLPTRVEFTFLVYPVEQSFTIPVTTLQGHSPHPLAVSCIRLI